MQDFLYEALVEQDSLCHHGILGQKWGVRRYQNADGSLTDAGRKRYTNDITKLNKLHVRAANYHNAAVTSTGLAKTIMTAKANKYAKKANREVAKIATKWEDHIKRRMQEEKANEEYNKVSDTFKKSGWKVDDSGDFGGDIYATKPSKLGSHKITISTLTDPGDTAGYIDDHMKKVNSNVSKLESNGDKIYKQSIEHITKDLYDNNVGDVQSQMSRSEFKNGLKAESAHVSNWDSAELGFYHPAYGDHSLDFEYDLENMKPIGRGVSMNG